MVSSKEKGKCWLVVGYHVGINGCSVHKYENQNNKCNTQGSSKQVSVCQLSVCGFKAE